MPTSRSQMFDTVPSADIPRTGPEIAGARPLGQHPPAAPDRPRRRGPREQRPAPPLPPRTFARVVNFDLACPNCTAVDAVRSASGMPWWKGTRRFDMWRSRWRCRACRHVFAVGLAIWPVRRAGNRPRLDGRPVDTIPSRAQVEALRELYGLVRAQSRGWREPVNLICTCGSVDDVNRPDCPLSDDEPD